MIEYSIFPGGKRRAVTFSYDDGPAQDERLIGLFNRYGVKATFFLIGQKYACMSPAELDAVRELYKGHEIGCHTLQHGWLERMPGGSVISEVIEGRKILEKIARKPVVGLSYPNSSLNDAVRQALASCGIVYARRGCFAYDPNETRFPQDFMQWRPTCHHRDALHLCGAFLDDLDNYWAGSLFYVYGHSFEFRTEEDWSYMEKVIRDLSGNSRIWYATNLEIFEYAAAQRSLRVSADETVFQNLTAIDVWVEKDREQILRIPAGKTLILS